jgi:Xaa-Pro aminopeptidase
VITKGAIVNTNISQVNWPEIYRERRNIVRKAVGNGVILWTGNTLQPRNYADNAYPFRQNSHFLYYTGLSEPDLVMVSFPEGDNDILFSRPKSLDDIVWSGGGRSTLDLAREAGIETIEDSERLGDCIAKARTQGKEIHYLPFYQTALLLRTAGLLNESPDLVAGKASRLLMEEVARQRNIKSEVEIDEIEEALGVTDRMHRAAMAVTHAGMREYEIAGIIQAVALSGNRQQAFKPIVTVHGEILHNDSYDGLLENGRLLLNDSGAESARFYASDITRTYPVNGRFNSLQANIYQIVLGMQLGAIEKIKPGIPYKDVHIAACLIMVEGLRAMGLMKGNPQDAVEAGAHALFFPHGIGHMLGLDVHDMEDLGDIVGYTKKEDRSSQFGLKYLRLSRPLEAGFTLTVEPGVYFVPLLMDRWQKERMHLKFIHYDSLDVFRTFGGIRIEDDVLVTSTGARVLGPGIPKTIPEIEEAMRKIRS